MKLLLTLAATASVALLATAASAESLADTVNARASSEASIGMHLALGGKAHAAAKPVYGASLGIRQGGQTATQALAAPLAKIVEFNFSDGKLAEARVGAVSFTENGAIGPDGQRLGFDTGSASTWGLLAVGLGATVFIVTDDKQNRYDWHKNMDVERLRHPDL